MRRVEIRAIQHSEGLQGVLLLYFADDSGQRRAIYNYLAPRTLKKRLHRMYRQSWRKNCDRIAQSGQAKKCNQELEI